MAYNRGPVDYDRCGWGTTWGCKEHIETSDVMLIVNAAMPEDHFDNGHRLFHTGCAPTTGTTTLQQRRQRESMRLVKS